MKKEFQMALPKNQRYVQPQNVREAMEVIQGLFNQYRHEPLTQQLLNYHLGLIQRLQTDIYVTAVKENDPQQLKRLDGMIEAMKTWTQIRTANRPFNAKMKNFKLVSSNRPKFKKHSHKIKGQHNFHAARH